MPGANASAEPEAITANNITNGMYANPANRLTITRSACCHIVFGLFIIILQNDRAHAPLGAGTEVSHRVKVVITGNHVNRTAPSGCVARLVGLE